MKNKKGLISILLTSVLFWGCGSTTESTSSAVTSTESAVKSIVSTVEVEETKETLNCLGYFQLEYPSGWEMSEDEDGAVTLDMTGDATHFIQIYGLYLADSEAGISDEELVDRWNEGMEEGIEGAAHEDYVVSDFGGEDWLVIDGNYPEFDGISDYRVISGLGRFNDGDEIFVASCLIIPDHADESYVEAYYDFMNSIKYSLPEVTENESESSEPESEEEKEESTPSATVPQINALGKALDYLAYSAFSYSGLVDQLEYEGFSTEDAIYGVDNCGADWNEQALKSAESYLKYSGFSYSGLIEQLEYEGFTEDESTYGVDNCGADWMEQAERVAESYMKYSSFSRSGLIDQLEYEGFSTEQAEHGADSVGL